MRVELSRAVLEQPAAFRHLTNIAWMFTDERHRWVVTDPKAVMVSAWLAGERKERRRILAEHAHTAARSAANAELRVRELESSPEWREGCWDVPADLAEKVLREPLVVVVENARCDGAFIRIVALRAGEKHLKRRLGDNGFERLRRTWANPLGDGDWVVVRHGGGSNTGHQVELAAGAEPTAARRVFVLVDSDRGGPDAPLGKTAGTVQKVCERLREQHGPALRIDLRILQKREVENYLPRDVLRAYSSKKLDRWDQLSEVDKDYSDLKMIFGDDLWKVLIDERHQGLFHDRALRERAGQRGGELDDIIGRLIALL